VKKKLIDWVLLEIDRNRICDVTLKRGFELDKTTISDVLGGRRFAELTEERCIRKIFTFLLAWNSAIT